MFLQHAELEGPLVSTAASQEAAAADALAAHVRNVMDLDPYVGSRMYTARSTGIVVEDTLRLIMKYRPGPLIHMDRNKAGTSGAITEKMRPDFLCWVNGALVFKVFCIQHSGSGGGAQAMPIGDMLDLSTAHGRLQALTCSCNIWRLLAGYASQAPHAPLEMGHLVRSHDNLRTYCVLQGFICESIRGFASQHAPLRQLRIAPGRVRQDGAEAAPEQACDIDGHVGPRLLGDTYTVHLAPVGVPCAGPPADPQTLACAVSGVLGGLAALHSEGFVHRDVRWPNVIFLPAERRWLLIDLEYAGRDNCDCSGAPYPLRFWSERTLDGGRYTFRSDLRMVAERLMGGLPYDLDEDGKHCGRSCWRASSRQRAQALEHTWLARYTSE